MHGHPLSTRDESNNWIARERTAAASEPSEEIWNPLHTDPASALRWGNLLRRHTEWEDLLRIIRGHTEARDHLLRPNRSVADRREEIIRAPLVELLRHLFNALSADRLKRTARQTSQLALQRLSPMGDVLVAFLMLEPLSDLVARLTRRNNRQPVAARAVLATRGHHLNDVARLEPILKRHETIIYLRPNTAVPNIRMDEISKVERRSSRSKLLHITLRRKHVHLILEDIQADAFKELRCIGDVALPLKELTQPCKLRVIGRIRAASILIAPVRGDPNLCDVVHGAGSDLHFKWSPIKSYHRRVQALVEVVLRHCYVVIKLTRDWAPHRVHRPKRRVALAEVFNHNADRKDVIDLREVRVLSGHLLVDGVQVLRTTGELCMNARTLQLWTEHLNRSRDICSASIAAHVNKSGELVIPLGLERLKGEVLKLPLHLPDAETLRKWRVDLKGLARNAPLLLNAERRKRAHVVQSVAKLDQHDADVL